jgi:hypothetical protein
MPLGKNPEFGSIFTYVGRRPLRGGVFAIEIVVPA